jgi:hypothetical protein
MEARFEFSSTERKVFAALTSEEQEVVIDQLLHELRMKLLREFPRLPPGPSQLGTVPPAVERVLAAARRAPPEPPPQPRERRERIEAGGEPRAEVPPRAGERRVPPPPPRAGERRVPPPPPLPPGLRR